MGIRQAYLSQQLMALREEGILRMSREGRFIYYRIADQKILDMITAAAQIKGVSMDMINSEKTTCGCTDLLKTRLLSKAVRKNKWEIQRNPRSN